MTEQEQTATLITPDFSEVSDRVAPGIYKVRVVGAKADKWEGKDGKKDTHYINWTLEQFDADEEKNNGRKLFHKTPINGAGAFRLQEFYRAAMGEECPAGGFDREMLLGRELEVTVIDGKTKAGELTGYTEVKTCKALKASH